MTALSWATPAFPVPVLPPPALRRSWLVDMLSGRQAGEHFYQLLKQLNPNGARQLGRARPLEVFTAVLFELHFPTESDYIIENIEFGESTLEDIWEWGIPIDVQGYHPDAGRLPLDLVAATCGDDYAADTFGVRGSHDELSKWVRTWWAGEAADLKPVKPPRGREFIQHWNGLPDLVNYATGRTGSDWLDLNHEDVDGMNCPPWSLAEIRALERQWKRVKPIEQRIYNLVGYIEKAPRTHLPTLDKALRGDKETLLAISRPKPQPLWKAFAKKAARR